MVYHTPSDNDPKPILLRSIINTQFSIWPGKKRLLRTYSNKNDNESIIISISSY